MHAYRYNIGHVAIGIGDLGLAYQTFKMAVSLDNNHAESFNNLGVLELRNGGIFAAKSNFSVSQSLAPYMFESFFNAALVTFKLGDYQESYHLIKKALAAYPGHFYSKEVERHLDHLLSAV
jgi:tetratricopeptide repeat protein 8